MSEVGQYTHAADSALSPLDQDRVAQFRAELFDGKYLVPEAAAAIGKSVRTLERLIQRLGVPVYRPAAPDDQAGRTAAGHGGRGAAADRRATARHGATPRRASAEGCQGGAGPDSRPGHEACPGCCQREHTPEIANPAVARGACDRIIQVGLI